MFAISLQLHMHKISVLYFLLVFVTVFDSVKAQKFPSVAPQARIAKLSPPEQKVPVVLDTDTYNEIDDQFALIYSLLSPEKIDLRAVYAAPYFNDRSSSPEDGMLKSYNEIMRILKMFGRENEGLAFRGSAEYLPGPQQSVVSDASADLIKKALAQPKDDPLFIVAVGAITNVASAILQKPEIINHMVVVWLGGHANHWPNTLEFNMKQDIHAANVVLTSGVPFVQLPCMGVVSHLSTTPSEIDSYVKGKGELGDYLDKIFDDYVKGDARSKVLWDMTAVAYIVNPDITPSYLAPTPEVSLTGKYTLDPRAHPMRYVYHINRDLLFEDFFRKIDLYKRPKKEAQGKQK